jgi:xylulokinase
MNSLAKLLWLRETAPEVAARAWRIVTYADFILGKLGGGR